MCTVSYIPIGSQTFVLTSNRDENPLRSPDSITEESKTIYPRDIKGGTWICASSNDKLVCLLNGAFLPHRHRPPYPKSRGIIVKEFFDYPDTETFFKDYDLEGIEPFTMAVWDKGNLYQLRRDTQKTYLTRLNPNESYLWSSAPLYDFPTQRIRHTRFGHWKKITEFTPDNILKFHKSKDENDERYGFMIDRGFLKTISITQVIRTNAGITMDYHDLLRNNTIKASIAFK